MFDLKPAEHHIELINLPELKPHELHGLFTLSKYLEPFTNRLVMMCEVQTTNKGKIIQREVKPMGLRSKDVPEVLGCGTITAFKLMKCLKEKNILRRDKDLFLNPKYIRAHNGIASATAVELFEQPAPSESDDEIDAELQS